MHDALGHLGINSWRRKIELSDRPPSSERTIAMHCIRSFELLTHWHSVEALVNVLLPIICHYLVGDAFIRLSHGVPSPFHLIDRISSPYLLGI